MIYNDLKFFLDIPLFKIAQDVSLPIFNPLREVDLNSIVKIKEYFNRQSKEIKVTDKTYIFTFSSFDKSFLTIDSFLFYEIPSSFSPYLNYDFELWKKLKKRNNQIEYAIQFRNNKKVSDFISRHIPLTEKCEISFNSKIDVSLEQIDFTAFKLLFNLNDHSFISKEIKGKKLILFSNDHLNFLNHLKYFQDSINLEDLEEKDQIILADLIFASTEYLQSINLKFLTNLNKISTSYKDKLINLYFQNKFSKLLYMNSDLYEIEIFQFKEIPQHLINNYIANNLTPFHSRKSFGRVLNYMNSDLIPEAFKKYLFEKFLSSLSESIFESNPENYEDLLILWYRILSSKHKDVFEVIKNITPSSLNDLLLTFFLEKIKLSEDLIFQILTRFYKSIPKINSLPFITPAIQFYYLYKGFNLNNQKKWSSFYSDYFHPLASSFLSTEQIEHINSLISKYQEINFTNVFSNSSGEGLYYKFQNTDSKSLHKIVIEHHSGNNPNYWASWTEIKGDDGSYDYYKLNFELFNQKYSFNEDQIIPSHLITLLEVIFFVDSFMENDSSYRVIDQVGYLVSESGQFQIALLLHLSEFEKIKNDLSNNDHNFFISQQNTLFFWGKNDYGQLGDGSTIKNLLPSKFGYFDNKGVDFFKVLLNENKTCILKGKNHFYFFGRSIDNYSQKERKNYYPIDISNAFSLNSNDLFITFNLFFDGYYAITKYGRLFLWEDEHIHSIDGLINKDFPYLIEITNIINLAIKDKIVLFSHGKKYFAILTFLGQIFLWGNNDYGQLGTLNTKTSNIPQNITFNLSLEFNDKVIVISCGDDFTSFLTLFGRLFLCGNNEYGQIGIGKKIPFIINIIEITHSFNLKTNEKIVVIKSQSIFNCAITTNGRVFVWGRIPYLIDKTSNRIFNAPFEVTSYFIIDKKDQFIDIEVFEKYALLTSKCNKSFIWTSEKIIYN